MSTARRTSRDSAFPVDGCRLEAAAFLVGPALALLVAGPLDRPRGRTRLLHLDHVPVGVLVDQRAAVMAAALVLRVDHLLDVLELELDLGLVGAGRLPVQELGRRRARILADR